MNSDNRNVDSIQGKRILYFSPATFGYEYKIVKKMNEMGAIVDMYDEKSVSEAWERALLKVTPKFFAYKTSKYYEKIISSNRKKNYDYILIVKCDMTPVSILKKFRTEYPNAKMCLYLWDSVKNIPGVTSKFKYFDTIHSFDSEDCKKYPMMKLRPLFYDDIYKNEPKTDMDYDYDICFIGTIHSDRYKVIKDIMRFAKENNMKSYWFLFLQSRFIYYFYKFTKKEFRDTQISDFSLKQMDGVEIASIVDKSRIIIDIQHPKQTGLTMRTIEMMGMNKKLITTNGNIRKYDFYNPNNISVIDRDNVSIDMDFWKTGYERLDERIYEKYSLKQWVLDVLS
jgi:hypothetical protein